MGGGRKGNGDLRNGGAYGEMGVVGVEGDRSRKMGG